MSADFTLLTIGNDFQGLKAIIAASFVGIDLNVSTTFQEADRHTPDFRRNYSPTGNNAVLVTPQGNLFGGNTVARFVAQFGANNLLGKTPFEAAQIGQWIDFEASEVEGPVTCWVSHSGDDKTAATARKWALQSLTALDEQLSRNTYIIGERISLADIVLAVSIARLYAHSFPAAERSQFVNLNRWLDTVANQPKFIAKYEVPVDTGAAPAKAAKAEKKKEEKKPEPKKEDAPKPKKKKDDDDEDDGADEAPREPTIKNPLDLLPPSPFVLDAYKRLYSNDKGNIRANSGAHLIENLDMAGYSAWMVTFNHCADYPLDFMLPNFLSGFYQRMEGNKLHKYGMGWLYITKQGGARHCEGFFIWRGAEGLPAILKSEVPDTELFTWTKIENLREHEERIFDFLTGEGKYFEGREWVDWKGFK